MTRPSPPSQLAEIQALMARAVMRPLTGSEGMQRLWPDGSPTARVAAEFIKPNNRLSSFDRLQIYNQQYWWRLLGSFGEDFRGLRAVLGERKFDKLAVAYLDNCGSQSWTMRNVGSRLEGFLREHPELTAPHALLALDMARVEWARIVAFDEGELPPLRAEKLRNASAAELRIGLQPYVSLLELSHPIDELLGKLKRREIETGSASNAVSELRTRRRPPLRARASREVIHLAVHRVELSVYYKRLSSPAFHLLAALRAGKTLEIACEEAFALSPELPETSAVKVQEWFADWMKFGWFTRAARG